MSIKQGSTVIAGIPTIDNSPTSGSTNAVSSGGVYTELAGKVDKGHQVTDFFMETSGDRRWYRKYADGWVEQGGSFSSGGSGNTTITLLVEMADTSYWVQTSRKSGASTTTNVNVWARTPTSTSQFVIYTSGDTSATWEVRGLYAV